MIARLLVNLRFTIKFCFTNLAACQFGLTHFNLFFTKLIKSNFFSALIVNFAKFIFFHEKKVVEILVTKRRPLPRNETSLQNVKSVKINLYRKTKTEIRLTSVASKEYFSFCFSDIKCLLNAILILQNCEESIQKSGNIQIHYF